jgi:NADH:ubiquinone oxidoreductase subunit 3 (subunit A)
MHRSGCFIAIAVVSLVAAIIVVSYLLGQRHKDPTTGEATVRLPPRLARLRFSVDYYLVAMFFVVFDVESIFIFAWAIAWRELGWAGYVAVLIFIGIMLAALAICGGGARLWTGRLKGRRKEDCMWSLGQVLRLQSRRQPSQVR